jgi:hypothetical protein
VAMEAGNIMMKCNACTFMRHHATNWKVAGSNPDEVDFFNLTNLSSRTLAQGST